MFWNSPRKSYERLIYAADTSQGAAYYGPLSIKISSNKRLSATNRQELLRQLQQFQHRRPSDITGSDWKIAAKKAVVNAAKQQVWGSNNSHLPANIRAGLRRVRGY